MHAQCGHWQPGLQCDALSISCRAHSSSGSCSGPPGDSAAGLVALFHSAAVLEPLQEDVPQDDFAGAGAGSLVGVKGSSGFSSWATGAVFHSEPPQDEAIAARRAGPVRFKVSFDATMLLAPIRPAPYIAAG